MATTVNMQPVRLRCSYPFRYITKMKLAAALGVCRRTLRAGTRLVKTARTKVGAVASCTRRGRGGHCSRDESEGGAAR